MNDQQRNAEESLARELVRLAFLAVAGVDIDAPDAVEVPVP